MVQLTHEQLLEVATVYLTSNTPYYFFDNLRRTVAVQTLAESQSNDDLVASVEQLAAQDPKSEESILTLFSVIGALSLKPASVSADFIRGIDLSDLRWGAQFTFFASNLVNNDTHVSWMTPQSQAPADTKQKIESNNQTLVFK